LGLLCRIRRSDQRLSGRAGGRALATWHAGENDPAPIRPIIAAFFVAFVVNAMLVWMYFFVVPPILAAAIAVCLGVAYVLARPHRSTQLG
jgi:sugar phosphate permease